MYQNLQAAPASWKNQLNGHCHDAAGNLLGQTACPATTYSYDAENRLSSTAGWTYVYDGDGRRVTKCNACTSSSGGTPYWTGTGNEALDETDLAGSVQREYIFFNGKRVARLDPPSTIRYFMADHLGSVSVVASSTGSIQDESDYYPYGGEIPIIDNLSPQPYKFTGKERDSETGLDYFGARYYGSNMGRFISPDPLYIESKRVGDPQRLNLYAYGRNNPLKFFDPTGLEIAINCANQQDCKTAEQQINERPGTLLSVSDKNGLLTAERTAAGPLTEQDQALLDAINDPDTRGTLNVVSGSGSIDFGINNLDANGNHTGSNTVDVADTAKLSQAGLSSGNAVAHEALEAYSIAGGANF